MRCAVAALVALSMSTTACFPNNEKHRTIAKVTEGGLMLGGIVMLAVVNTSADCDADQMLGMKDDSCARRAELLSNIGLTAILAGLIGFIVTVSTSPDDNATVAPAVTTPPAPAPATEPAPATP